jgi:hypothetical protein
MYITPIFKARMGDKLLTISGAPILNFEKGWAKYADHKVTHYFKRANANEVFTRCGLRCYFEDNGGKNLACLFGAGNIPHCKACQRSVDRRP